MSDDLFLIRYGDQDGWQFGLQIGETSFALKGQTAQLDWLLLESFPPQGDILQRVQNAKAEPIDWEDKMLYPPVDSQEIWAAGVTYKRSEEARELESHNSTIYTRVYSAKRPELFFKANGKDVVGNNWPVGIRADATWSVPEPELIIVLDAKMDVVGFTIGNDMSSRDIEGENPLYLPQAKVYERSCAMGPRIWLQPGATEWPVVEIEMTIHRNGQPVFHDKTSTANIKRPMSELIDYLGRCKRFHTGVYLFTGTGIVPPDSFTLQAEDEVRIRIDPIGELVNKVMVVGRK